MSGIDQGTEINGATLGQDQSNILWETAGFTAHVAPHFAVFPEAASGLAEAVIPAELEVVVPAESETVVT